ncbi:MAG: ABC transporter permease [Lachnospiraceae bacterium]|nr:ABC transporter permease [Lachnospiraceae bacterium]
MLSLLRCEWYQVRKSLSLKITVIILVVASVIFGCKITDAANISNIKAWDQMYLLYFGGGVYSAMSDGAMALLVASLFAGWMIGGSFENRMIQESISYGKKRSSVYLAKMLMYSIVVIMLCLIYWCFTALPAGLKNGLGTADICGNLVQIHYIIGMVAAGSMAYISVITICGVIAFFVRKTGATMGICFVGILFGGNLLASILSEDIIKIVNYTPLGLYRHVLKLDVTLFDICQTVMISLFWIILFWTIGYLKFQKTELK